MATHSHPMQILDEATGAIAAGDYRTGADLMYQAAHKAVRQAALHLDALRETDDQINEFLLRMDGIPPPAPDLDPTRLIKHYTKHINSDAFQHRVSFDITRSFKRYTQAPAEHSYPDSTPDWLPEECQMFMPSVRAFVAAMEHAEMPAKTR